MSAYLADTFREEALELLSELEDALLELEERPGDRETVGRVFRALHTLKGSGAMAGFDALAAFAHELETVFERVRDGRLAVSRKLINLTLAGRDELRSLIEATRDDLADARVVSEITAVLRNLCAAPETSPEVLPLASDSGSEEATWRIRFRPQQQILQRGINPLALLRELARLGECRTVAQVDAIPGLEALDPDLCYLYWDILLTTDRSIDAIRDIFIFVEGEAEIRIEMVDSDLLADADTDYKKLGEILVERGDLSLADLEKILQDKRRLGEALIESGLVSSTLIDSALAEQERVREVRRQRQQQEAGGGIRVRSEKLDALVDLVGELVTVQARLSQHCAGDEDHALQAITEEVERLTWSLRDQVLGIRMLPIGTTFSRFRRLVRDLGEELGKEVELVTEGGETELDKTVIERLGEPLVHLIRNGIDHGIETPVVRRAKGKAEAGRIRLGAAHSGANVVLTVSDDGAGLDRQAIRNKAVAQGLLAAEAEISDRELLGLIFLPGFSTAALVTSVSGRGVGMDVVKRAVEALRGSMEVTSRPGEGTTFQIRLPLTLAIIDGLLVRVGGGFYVLPLSAVEECIELRRGAALDNGRTLARVRGEIVPYVRLRDFFRVGGEAPAIEQVVVVEAGGQRFGLAVDMVVGGHQTVIKSLGRLYREVTGLSGATILGDGTVALILDLSRLVASVETAEKTAVEA